MSLDRNEFFRQAVRRICGSCGLPPILVPVVKLERSSFGGSLLVSKAVASRGEG
jgi:hypothetical protein